MLKSKKLDSRGFTLIELLIVIIIIGILAVIGFVVYSGATNRAHKADAKSTVSQVKTKLGEYNAIHDTYPDSKASVVNWLTSDEGGNNDSMADDFDNGAYTYNGLEPTGCGDAVDGAGDITEGSTNCTGYTLTAEASMWSGDEDIVLKN